LSSVFEYLLPAKCYSDKKSDIRTTVNLKQRISTNHILAICLGIVYIWFGVLKFFPGVSPAEELAQETMYDLTFGLIPTKISYFLLAVWETGLGLLLLLNIYRKWVLLFAFVHVVLTFTPMFFIPELAYNKSPLLPTLLGQYIAKNIIIIGALVTLWKENRKSNTNN
jgi:uncharacterized membrane protein YphA (DoxX/SURF4 family)